MQPMPSPRGTNYARKFLLDNFPTRVLAMDAALLPSNALAAGKLTGKAPAARKLDNGKINGDRRARDQDPGGAIGEEAFGEALSVLRAVLSEEAYRRVEGIIAEELNGQENDNGNGVAQDSYSRRFPNDARLRPSSTTPRTSVSRHMSYEQRFPNAGRLHRAPF